MRNRLQARKRKVQPRAALLITALPRPGVLADRTDACHDAWRYVCGIWFAADAIRPCGSVLWTGTVSTR